MKILIADDHALFRDGLSLQVEKIAPQASITQAANFSQALKIGLDLGQPHRIGQSVKLPYHCFSPFYALWSKVGTSSLTKSNIS